MHTLYRTLIVVAVLAVYLVGCGRSGPTGTQASSALSQDEVAAIVEEAMQAFDRGDYEAWSRHWSQAMKGAIKERDFLAFRTQVLQERGRYIAVDSVELQPSRTSGFVRWVATVTFEGGKLRMVFTFPVVGTLIEGIFSEPI